MNRVNDRASLLYTTATRIIVIVTSMAAMLFILRGGSVSAALLPAGVEAAFLLIDRFVWAFPPEPDPMGMLDDIKEKQPVKEFYYE